MNFAVYDLESGSIDRLIMCPQHLIESQLKEGEAYILIAEFTPRLDSTHYVVNGELTQKQ